MKKAIALFTLILLCLNSFSQTWLKVACGAQFSVALRSDGTLWSWGANKSNAGQLGLDIGSTTHIETPTQIGSDHDWKDIAAGAAHCLALKSSGTMWAWGWNYGGEIGDGTTIQRNSPVQAGTDNDWKNVYCGMLCSYAIKNDGSLWAWGWTYMGQLGIGQTTESYNKTPTQVGTDKDWLMVSGGGAAVIVGGALTSAGYALGLKTDGTLWAWGANEHGELGDGTTQEKYSPVKIGNDNNWRQLATGLSSSSALKSDHTLWSWGDNFLGALGIGNELQQSAPVQASGTDWNQLTRGPSYGLAIKTNGTLWGWGQNSNGQLGDGTKVKKLSPVLIGNDNDWSFIAAAKAVLANNNTTVVGYHSLGMKNQKTFLCSTGRNVDGQLGNGTTADQSSFSCDVVTSIQETNQEKNTIEVFPNPGSGEFNISFASKQQDCTMDFHNAIGQLLLREDWNKASGIYTKHFNLGSLEKGIYFLSVKEKEHMEVKKIIFY